MDPQLRQRSPSRFIYVSVGMAGLSCCFWLWTMWGWSCWMTSSNCPSSKLSNTGIWMHLLQQQSRRPTNRSESDVWQRIGVRIPQMYIYHSKEGEGGELEKFNQLVWKTLGPKVLWELEYVQHTFPCAKWRVWWWSATYPCCLTSFGISVSVRKPRWLAWTCVFGACIWFCDGCSLCWPCSSPWSSQLACGKQKKSWNFRESSFQSCWELGALVPFLLGLLLNVILRVFWDRLHLSSPWLHLGFALACFGSCQAIRMTEPFCNFYIFWAFIVTVVYLAFPKATVWRVVA